MLSAQLLVQQDMLRRHQTKVVSVPLGAYGAKSQRLGFESLQFYQCNLQSMKHPCFVRGPETWGNMMRTTTHSAKWYAFGFVASEPFPIALCPLGDPAFQETSDIVYDSTVSSGVGHDGRPSTKAIALLSKKICISFRNLSCWIDLIFQCLAGKDLLGSSLASTWPLCKSTVTSMATRRSKVVLIWSNLLNTPLVSA